MVVTAISPPPVPFKNVEKCAEDTPKVQSPPKDSPVDLLRQQYADADSEIEARLQSMVEHLKSMAATFKVQKNVNQKVKGGVSALEEDLSYLLECRKVAQRALAQERTLLDKRVTQEERKLPAKKRARPSPSASPDAAEKPPTKSKATQTDRPQKSAARPVQTPAKSAAIPGPSPKPLTPQPKTPRRREEGGSTSGEWRQQLSKKEKKKMRRAEVANRSKTKDSSSANAKTTVTVKAGKKQRPRKPRSEAILIKPLGGRSFAEVLGEIRSKAEPERTQTVVKSVRKTQNGDILLELGKTADKAAFAANLKQVLGDRGQLRALEPKSSVEIRDLDGLTTEGEVTEAIRKALPGLPGDGGALKVWLTQPNRSQQRMAVAEMADSFSSKLLAQTHLKVGWVSCRLRRRVEVPRCYRCLGFGHSSRVCKGPSRAKNCLKCGLEGHARKSCTVNTCFLCKENGQSGDALLHLPGSGKCSAFKAALDQAKAKSAAR